ncbi:MAG: lipopolysaccharide biosynthesis protein [Rhodothermales bacterium]|nr:lipopolysaccharide biosynthesis protein [Rhodothermales bacterium]
MHETQSKTDHGQDFFRPPRDRSLIDEPSLWRALGTLYRRRAFIVAMTALVAVAAIVISLLLPVWYKATTRLLTPEGSGAGGFASMLSEFAPEAASLLGGGGGGEINRYFAILSSRSLMTSVVRRFDLMNVYEIEPSETALDDTIELLRANTEFTLDQEFEYLSIQVLDRDPQRAADIANYFVQELNRVNSELSAQNASLYTGFVSESLQGAEMALDSARAVMQRFQEKHGVIDLPTQTQAFLESVANLRRDVLEAEIQYEVLRDQLGPENARTRSAQMLAEAAKSKYDAALGGAERLLPVPQSRIPSLANQYAELLQEILIQGEIVKFVRPLYEQARFDEQREKVAVQVLDPAVPPSRKAKPVRSIIVIVATISGFLLSIIFVLLYDYVKREHRSLLARLEAGVDGG